MTNEVYFIVPAGLNNGGKPEVYDMVPSGNGENQEVYFMNPIGDVNLEYKWVYYGSAMFPASACVTAYSATPGDYASGYQTLTFPADADTVRIKHKSGAIYYGAAANFFRSGAGAWKSRVDFATQNTGNCLTANQADIEADGMIIEVVLGDDRTLNNGGDMRPLAADRSGIAYFDLWYRIPK